MAQPLLPPITSPPPLDIPALRPLAPSTDSPKETVRLQRPAHANVLARLQALFPSQHPSPAPETSPVPPSPPPPDPPLPKFIKVRILTWNMHDSLPKGDVEELLGSVPTTTLPAPSPHDPPTLPIFPASPDHPYHIVIVAGQECPSASGEFPDASRLDHPLTSSSGIPMALGAGFKLNNKDNSRSRHSLLPQDPDDPIQRKSADTELLSPVADKPHDHHHPPSSWSSILENWYCHPSTIPTTSSASDPNISTQHELQRAAGPYEFLIKERMMGLYLAVFIHRDALPFVRGSSKSAVTTGLIGGRVGNKGGVGVSVNLDGTTLLFINAHLAAHESRVHHRIADLAKIKAELSVNDFLSPDDPRFMAEDISDRFDTTFVFGDLNFRLDVTRLHADWLISRKAYEQALEFDQLRKVMDAGEAFVGFNEGNIRFPPTFKYDVLRTIKRPRHRSFKRMPGTPTIVTTPHEKLLSEVLEQDREHRPAQDDQQDRMSQTDRNGDDDAESVVSSMWTSVRSRRTVDPEDEAEDSEPGSAAYFVQSPMANGSAPNLIHKMRAVVAARKAKEKWTALFSPIGPKSPSPNLDPGNQMSKWRQSWSPRKSPGPTRRASHPTADRTAGDPSDPDSAKAGRAKEFQSALIDAAHARPHKHLALSESNVDLEADDDKGVYDSSHKQRVPSWCDRILWKSTIVHDPEPDTLDTESQRFMPFRAKVGQIFHALRPSSLRSRRDSTWSIHPDIQQQATPLDEHKHNVLIHPVPDKRRLNRPRASSPPRAKSHPLVRLPQTRSVDSLHKSSPLEKPALTRIHSLDPHPPEAPFARVPLRHAYTISPVMPVGDPSTASTTLVSSPGPSSPVEANAPNVVPSPSAPVFRWLLPFLYRDASQHQATQPSDIAAAAPLQPPPPPPRRGDVVCLKYDTLDDRGMRRLEGRSDHRPVIGAYALYI